MKRSICSAILYRFLPNCAGRNTVIQNSLDILCFFVFPPQGFEHGGLDSCPLPTPILPEIRHPLKSISSSPCLFRISLFSISGPRSGGTYIGRPLDAASILFIVQYSAKKSSFPR